VLAERLSNHPAVSEVRHAGLACHPQHQPSHETLARPGFADRQRALAYTTISG
jgi:cystathionine beta-lyase/cystathionine gamma-synthase